jgi:hypothetical protein
MPILNQDENAKSAQRRDTTEKYGEKSHSEADKVIV